MESGLTPSRGRGIWSYPYKREWRELSTHSRIIRKLLSSALQEGEQSAHSRIIRRPLSAALHQGSILLKDLLENIPVESPCWQSITAQNVPVVKSLESPFGKESPLRSPLARSFESPCWKSPLGSLLWKSLVGKESLLADPLVATSLLVTSEGWDIVSV